MLQTLMLAVLLFFPHGVLAFQSPSLHGDIAATLEAQGLAGAVWATLDPETGIVIDAAGVRDSRTGRSLRPDDRVHIGSVTKTLLAAGVLRLVSQDRLALETPVSQLLPGVAFDNPWMVSDPVRVRHLLDHTAGLDDARLWQVFSTKSEVDTPLAAAFAEDSGLLRLRSRPGTRFSYSNMGYGLLGMVIEAVTGQRYESYLDQHLLLPLSMHDSTFAFVSQEAPHADSRLAMGHFEHGQVQAAVPTFLRPATQFTTTARDMAAFARFLMGDGRVGGEPFIDPQLLRAMGRPVDTEAARAGLRAGYGLGLATHDRHGAAGRCHGGNTVGYRAMFCLFPEQQRAFFLSINADSETADYGAFDQRLVEALGLAAFAPAPSSSSTSDRAEWAGFYVPAPNRFEHFAWVDTVLGFMHLRPNGPALRLAPFQGAAVSLTPVGGNLFRAPDRVAASHALLISSEGERLISTGTQTFQQISLLKLVPLWASLLLGLFGIAYILVSGLIRASARRMQASDPVFIPFLAVLALMLPVPLFFRQSFLALGDLTLASGSLAMVTAALPLAMVTGLWRFARRRRAGTVAALDAGAMLAILQWSIVLATWGLVPLRLWV